MILYSTLFLTNERNDPIAVSGAKIYSFFIFLKQKQNYKGNRNMYTQTDFLHLKIIENKN